MSQVIAQAIAKKALGDYAKKNFNGQNPYEERVTVYDRQGNATGKTKKQKRAIPNGLSQNDAQVLKRVRSRAYHLDMSLFNLCGIRFGWSSVIGIIPVIGDFIDLFMALLVIRKAEKIDGGLPMMLRSRMYVNIMLDFGIGLIPILGDLADALYRANTRNAWLLEVYLTDKLEAERQGRVQDPETGDVLPTKPTTARLVSGQSAGVLESGRRHPDEEMAVGQVSKGR